MERWVEDTGLFAGCKYILSRQFLKLGALRNISLFCPIVIHERANDGRPEGGTVVPFQRPVAAINTREAVRHPPVGRRLVASPFPRRFWNSKSLSRHLLRGNEIVLMASLSSPRSLSVLGPRSTISNEYLHERMTKWRRRCPSSFPHISDVGRRSSSLFFFLPREVVIAPPTTHRPNDGNVDERLPGHFFLRLDA
jgi:hypothetical protein